jgi:hypothetical protein
MCWKIAFSRPPVASATCVANSQQDNPMNLQKSSFSSSSSSNNNRIVKGPSERLKSWQSGARLVKNTTVENQYLEHIRDLHDPSLHLKTIEDELKGTIGKALRKQSDKILMFGRLMHQEREKYEALLLQQQESNDNFPKHLQLKLRQHAKQHNQYRNDSLHARWELIVHRQAVGFIVGNHKYVMENYPIAEALPENQKEQEESDDDKVGVAKKTRKDQLDWWDRIGRWR